MKIQAVEFRPLLMRQPAAAALLLLCRWLKLMGMTKAWLLWKRC
jgi:hypothetical protein